MLELYHNDMSSCAQKVRIVLAEKGLEWKSIHLNLRKGESRTDNYKKINKNGVVPTLITESKEIIIESTVIMEYLDDAYPKAPLMSKNPFVRAKTRLWMKQLDEGIHACLATISNAVAFRYQHMEGRSKKELEAYFGGIPDPVRRKRIRDVTFKGTASEYFKPAMQRFELLFSDMDSTLKDNDWLAGDEYTLADIAYMPYLTRFDHLQLLGLLDSKPKVLDWYERIKVLPSYKQGIVEWLNQNYLPLLREKGLEAWPDIKNMLV